MNSGAGGIPSTRLGKGLTLVCLHCEIALWPERNETICKMSRSLTHRRKERGLRYQEEKYPVPKKSPPTPAQRFRATNRSIGKLPPPLPVFIEPNQSIRVTHYQLHYAICLSEQLNTHGVKSSQVQRSQWLSMRKVSVGWFPRGPIERDLSREMNLLDRDEEHFWSRIIKTGMNL
ncbi:hypothetical protein TNCV_610951 [Trichonephila clavipes]|nr:hypothetical protein TNCV_610951 [Trichonephila clavipes]